MSPKYSIFNRVISFFIAAGFLLCDPTVRLAAASSGSGHEVSFQALAPESGFEERKRAGTEAKGPALTVTGIDLSLAQDKAVDITVKTYFDKDYFFKTFKLKDGEGSSLYGSFTPAEKFKLAANDPRWEILDPEGLLRSIHYDLFAYDDNFERRLEVALRKIDPGIKLPLLISHPSTRYPNEGHLTEYGFGLISRLPAHLRAAWARHMYLHATYPKAPEERIQALQGQELYELVKELSRLQNVEVAIAPLGPTTFVTAPPRNVLPKDGKEITKDQRDFLDRAVEAIYGGGTLGEMYQEADNHRPFRSYQLNPAAKPDDKKLYKQLDPAGIWKSSYVSVFAFEDLLDRAGQIMALQEVRDVQPPDVYMMFSRRYDDRGQLSTLEKAEKRVYVPDAGHLQRILRLSKEDRIKIAAYALRRLQNPGMDEKLFWDGLGFSMDSVYAQLASIERQEKAERVASQQTTFEASPADHTPSLGFTATRSVAADLVRKGYRGINAGINKKDPTQKAVYEHNKAEADRRAEQVTRASFVKENLKGLTHAAEGAVVDEILEAFQAAEIINPGGTGGTVHILSDVIEGTDATATNNKGKSLKSKTLAEKESGGTSALVTGAGVEALGIIPESYAEQIYTHVPPEKRWEVQDFLEKNALAAEDEGVLEQVLQVIADANGITINDIELVTLDRPREAKRFAALDRIKARYPGLAFVRIDAGTVAHGLLAAIGTRKGKKHKVMLTGGKTTEAAMNLAVAAAIEGGVGAFVAASKDYTKNPDGTPATDLSNRTRWNKKEIEAIEKQRAATGDVDAYKAGTRIFGIREILAKGPIEANFSFITDNGVFKMPGVEKIGEDLYRVHVLRIREGKASIVVEDVPYAQITTLMAAPVSPVTPAPEAVPAPTVPPVPGVPPVSPAPAGPAVTTTGVGLTPEQHEVVNKAIRSYHDDQLAKEYGFQNVTRVKNYLLSRQSPEYRSLDPGGALAKAGVKIYRLAGAEQAENLDFRIREVARRNKLTMMVFDTQPVDVPINEPIAMPELLSHPTSHPEKFGYQVSLSANGFNKLKKLSELARIQWATHVLVHLQHPELVEEVIHQIAPIDILLAELKAQAIPAVSAKAPAEVATQVEGGTAAGPVAGVGPAIGRSLVELVEPMVAPGEGPVAPTGPPTGTGAASVGRSPEAKALIISSGTDLIAELQKPLAADETERVIQVDDRAISELLDSMLRSGVYVLPPEGGPVKAMVLDQTGTLYEMKGYPPQFPGYDMDWSSAPGALAYARFHVRELIESSRYSDIPGYDPKEVLKKFNKAMIVVTPGDHIGGMMDHAALTYGERIYVPVGIAKHFNSKSQFENNKKYLAKALAEAAVHLTYGDWKHAYFKHDPEIQNYLRQFTRLDPRIKVEVVATLGKVPRGGYMSVGDKLLAARVEPQAAWRNILLDGSETAGGQGPTAGYMGESKFPEEVKRSWLEETLRQPQENLYVRLRPGQEPLVSMGRLVEHTEFGDNIVRRALSADEMSHYAPIIQKLKEAGELLKTIKTPAVKDGLVSSDEIRQTSIGMEFVILAGKLLVAGGHSAHAATTFGERDYMGELFLRSSKIDAAKLAEHIGNEGTHIAIRRRTKELYKERPELITGDPDHTLFQHNPDSERDAIAVVADQLALADKELSAMKAFEKSLWLDRFKAVGVVGKELYLYGEPSEEYIPKGKPFLRIDGTKESGKYPIISRAEHPLESFSVRMQASQQGPSNKPREPIFGQRKPILADRPARAKGPETHVAETLIDSLEYKPNDAIVIAIGERFVVLKGEDLDKGIPVAVKEAYDFKTQSDPVKVYVVAKSVLEKNAGLKNLIAGSLKPTAGYMAVAEDVYSLPNGPKVSMDDVDAYVAKTRAAMGYENPKVVAEGADLIFKDGAVEKARITGTPLAEVLSRAGLTEIPLMKTEGLTDEAAINQLNWLTQVVKLASADRFTTGVLWHAPSQADKINVKVVTIDQIENDFADPATAAMIEADLKAGVRYVVLTKVGEDPKASLVRLAKGNVRDKNWFYNPETKEGGIHIMAAIEAGNSLDLTAAMEGFRTGELRDAVGKEITPDTWKTYLANPNDPNEKTNLVAAVHHGVRLKGARDGRIRHFFAEPGIRLSEVLSVLQGLFSRPLAFLVTDSQYRQTFLDAGYTKPELASVAADPSSLQPPATTSDMMQILTDKKKSDKLTNWTA